jgi:hypothetical protein
MKIIDCNRETVYKILNAAFNSLETRPKLIELGVLRGDNAILLYEFLSPISLHLVDVWSSQPQIDYRTINRSRDWVSDPSEFDAYFGGSVYDQATFDRIYDSVLKRFKDKENIEIIRASTSDAYRMLSHSQFDLIYVDANHQYESVLDDLINFSKLLTTNGVLQLNDCCHSDLGVKQNLGVLEAAVKFCKMSGFVPLLLTNSDWSDVLLVHKNSQLAKLIDQVVVGSSLRFVEIPDQLLGAAIVRQGKLKNLSFL